MYNVYVYIYIYIYVDIDRYMKLSTKIYQRHRTPQPRVTSLETITNNKYSNYKPIQLQAITLNKPNNNYNNHNNYKQTK